MRRSPVERKELLGRKAQRGSVSQARLDRFDAEHRLGALLQICEAVPAPESHLTENLSGNLDSQLGQPSIQCCNLEPPDLRIEMQMPTGIGLGVASVRRARFQIPKRPALCADRTIAAN